MYVVRSSMRYRNAALSIKRLHTHMLMHLLVSEAREFAQVSQPTLAKICPRNSSPNSGHEVSLSTISRSFSRPGSWPGGFVYSCMPPSHQSSFLLWVKYGRSCQGPVVRSVWTICAELAKTAAETSSDLTAK